MAQMAADQHDLCASTPSAFQQVSVDRNDRRLSLSKPEIVAIY
jgi:hypothetical protein